MRERRDVGETLIEILLTIVITGITIVALLSSLASAGNAGNAQRNNVRADIVMRNYAEAAKTAAQSCVTGQPLNVTFVPPVGYAVTAEPTDALCATIASSRVLQVTVTGPQGLHETMQIAVRTP